MIEICRVCLKASTDLQRCFGLLVDTKELQVTILEAFEIMGFVQAKEEDFLCGRCFSQLRDCFVFVKQAKDNDVHFKKMQNLETLEDLGEVTNIKDPLEDSDFEFEKENVSNRNELFFESSQLKENDVPSLLCEENDTDEDNKPLIMVINKNQEETKELDNLVPEQVVQTVDSDSLSEDDDFTASLEDKIFPQGNFKCSICLKSYFTEIGLEAHNDFHLPKDSSLKKKQTRGPYKKRRKAKTSQTAEENSKDTQTLKEEILSEAELLPLANETKPEKSSSQRNKVTKPKKLFPCQYCGKELISASKLRYHLVMHTGEKNFLCTMCPKAYSTIYALKHHMRTHTGERPYECKFCGDRFLRPTTLKSHMRRHTGERPYGCEICGKRFIQHSSMATHMKLNHMDKTISCPHCDKKYARKTDLNMHLLSHTGDKPFACKLCPSRFIRQANLNKHINTHHSDMKTSMEDDRPSTSNDLRGLELQPGKIPPHTEGINSKKNSQQFEEYLNTNVNEEIILSSIIME